MLDGAKNGFLLSDFAHQLRRENADVSNIYLALLDAPGISQTLVPNQNDKTKVTRSCVAFKIWTLKAAQYLHTG